MLPLYPLRFHFECLDPVYFPPGKPSNVLRGAFGLLLRKAACEASCQAAEGCARRDSCVYARIFEPRQSEGPSGLADPPRPFVFRALHLDGRRFARGAAFHFDLNLFVAEPWPLPYLARAFGFLEQDGLGPGRGRVRLSGIDCAGVRILDGARWMNHLPGPVTPEPRRSSAASRIRIDFLTPTELKAQSALAREPDFATVVSRARDRIANLAALYGGREIAIDFKALRMAAEKVQMERWEIRDAAPVERTSGRTGQTHALGGFTGWAAYRGEFGPFLEILAAAEYTGIGRQTVWGKGEIRVTPVS